MTTAVATRIPALTVHNPWAAAIAYGGKSVENRSWPPPPKLIGGRLFIHAGKAQDRHGVAVVRHLAPDALGRVLPSAIVAAVTVAGFCHPAACDGLCNRWAVAGQYHWRLVDVVAFADPVVDVAGRQGLWYPGGDLAERAATALVRSTPHTTPIECTGRTSVARRLCGRRLWPAPAETWPGFETRARVQGWRISPDAAHAMCPRCGGAPSAATPAGD